MQLDGSKVVNTSSNEGVLANFFNSLLHKKSGSPTVPTGTPKTPMSLDSSVDKAAMRSDAAAELDRLARGRTPVDPSTPNAGSSSGTPSGIDFNASDC